MKEIFWNFNVDHSKSWDEEEMYNFTTAISFDVFHRGNRNPGDKLLASLLSSPAIKASGFAMQPSHGDTREPNRPKTSQTEWLSSDLNELCDRLN